MCRVIDGDAWRRGANIEVHAWCKAGGALVVGLAWLADCWRARLCPCDDTG